MLVYREVEKKKINKLRMDLAMRGINPDKVVQRVDKAEEEKEIKIITAEKTLASIGLGRSIKKPQG